MSDLPLSLIYFAGIAQAAFLICALASLRVRHSAARWTLVALIAAFSIMLAEELFDSLGRPWGLGLGLAVEFALAPLLYLLVRSLVRSEPMSIANSAWHFAPLGAACLALVWLHGNAGPLGVSSSDPQVGALVTGVVLIKIAYFFAYSAATLALPLPAEASPQRLDALANLRRLFVACVVVYALNAASFIAFVAGVPLAPDSDAVGGFLIALSLFAFGYFALVNREVFDLRDPYDVAALSGEEAQAIRARAETYLATSDAFLNPEFGQKDLARAIGVPAARLSQAMNAGGGGGFKPLINRYRLQAFLAARARPENRDRSALDLAFEAGFNSKATFYRVLKAGEARPDGLPA